MNPLSNSYALLIGVGADLPASARDAQSLHDLFRNPQIAGYPEENVMLLTNEKATREGMLQALDALIEKTDEDSSVVIFYSGHGGTYTDNDIIELEQGAGTQLKNEEENQTHYYWVPNGFDPKKFRETWLLASELKEKLKALQTRRLVMFLDCCHAEGMTKNAPVIKKNSLTDRLRNPEGLMHRIDDGKGVSILSSCRAEEQSWIIPQEAPNSLFTTCLLEVLKGEHATRFENPVIRMTDVIHYTMRRVPEVQTVQRPFVNLQMYDDFALSRVPKNANNQQENSTTSTAIETNTSKQHNPQMVDHFRENHGVNAVLFIHGFSGEAHTSFGEVPKLLEQEEAMKGWDLFPLGYSENHTPELGNDIYASALDIDTLADNIVSSIIHRFGDYKRIALIAHSVGGLALQKALVKLPDELLSKVSHVLLFASPNLGIMSRKLLDTLGERTKALDFEGAYIKNIRETWQQRFKGAYPFTIKAVAGTEDAHFETETCHQPFDDSQRVTVAGNHFTIVKPESVAHDGYQLIVKTLTQTTFLNEYTNREEINLILGDYDAVVKKLLPKKDSLKGRALRQLIFALEGLDRKEEVISLLENHPSLKENTQLLGLLGGRIKREFLLSFQDEDGERAYEFYEKALGIAQEKKDTQEIYYHAINMAFLSLVYQEEKQEMREFAQIALTAAQEDSFDTIWKQATIAEASLYLGDLTTSKEFYIKAASGAGIREKISMHTNALIAYSTLMEVDDDPFITFLKRTLLSK